MRTAAAIQRVAQQVMDDRRFDRLTTALATVPSRRWILRWFSSVGLGVLLPRAVSDVTAAKRKRHGKKCKGGKKKCGKRCIPKSNCCSPSDCPQGEKCRDGRCANCASAADCPTPPACQEAACQDGRRGTTLLPAGISCESDPLCNVNKTCDGAGACQGGTPDDRLCSASDPCQIGRCDPADDDSDQNGCVFEPVNCPVADPSTCGNSGLCAGGVCRKYGAETTCRAASCVGTTLQPAARCNGNGECLVPPTRSCAPFVCHENGIDCIGRCGGEVDCIPGLICVLGQCRPKFENGEDCNFSFQCKSGLCDFVPGSKTCQPKRADGELCTFAEQCVSGFCVANVCCSEPCAGADKICTGGICQDA